MTKYIVIEASLIKKPNPFWCPEVGTLESQHIEVTRSIVSTFRTEEELTRYLVAIYRADKRIEVYEVARQLTPVIETKTVVEFK